MFNLQLKGKTEGNGAACMESDCVWKCSAS